MPGTDVLTSLLQKNHPWNFWGLSRSVPLSAWDTAATALADQHELARFALDHGWDEFLLHTLGEARFGPDRYRLSFAKRSYYFLRPFLPRPVTRLVRRAYTTSQETSFPLGWPADDGFAAFYTGLRDQVVRAFPDAVPVPLWPDGADMSCVLTHDVETDAGQRHIPVIADLEESLGFRSSFNLIPESYAVDHGLIADLRSRGFEVGVHGLEHDGKLYFSQERFQRRAQRINRYVEEWGATGFRSPLMHRNPEWLQSLDIDYDLSFFDTDPFEPMQGGVGTVWPYFLGRFVELPYTLVQDHTLIHLLHHRDAALWIEKFDTLRRWRGMALLNAHPDYLMSTEHLAIYRELLEYVHEQDRVWRALPAEVARWWRRRADIAQRP